MTRNPQTRFQVSERSKDCSLGQSTQFRLSRVITYTKMCIEAFVLRVCYEWKRTPKRQIEDREVKKNVTNLNY